MTTTSPAGAFRKFLDPVADPRVGSLRGKTPYEYAVIAETGPFTSDLIEGWSKLYPAEFTGVTSDGHVIDMLYPLTEPPPDERVPVDAMVTAAKRVLDALTQTQRAKVGYAVDALEWQSWSNPEFLIHDTGVRVEFLGPKARDAILGLIAASTSPDGFDLVRATMRINGFLGDIVGLPNIMNEFSYQFAIYGIPSLAEPWGWQLFGHHLAINCVVVAGRMVMTPLFLGAEPNLIDDGPHAGASAFVARNALAHQLMAALTPDQQRRATVYQHLTDPAMPEGRVHPGDERTLAGAFEDNRVIPYEGILVSELSVEAMAIVDAIITDSLRHLPRGAALRRRREIDAHLDRTWFSWIGGHGPNDVIYYRIQSPVVIFEFDDHCGVWLNNKAPQPFHIHTTERTPNGNDYGRAFVRAHATPPTR